MKNGYVVLPTVKTIHQEKKLTLEQMQKLVESLFPIKDQIILMEA